MPIKELWGTANLKIIMRLKGGEMKMEFDKKPLKESTRMKLQSYHVFPKTEITEEQGLVLLGETLLEQLSAIWKQLFRECELQGLAMSKKEVIAWTIKKMVERKVA